MSDIQIAFAKESIQHEGQTIIIEPPNYDTRRQYSCYLESMAIESIIRNKAAYGREYKEARKDLALASASGAFEWGGQLWGDSLQIDERCRELSFTTLRQAQPAMTREKFNALWETPDKWVDDEGQEQDGCKGHNIIRAILRLSNRPNSPRPDQPGKNGELGPN